MRRNLLFAAVAAATLVLAPVAGAAGRWIHIRVEEKGPGGERVRVNVPLSMVETILPLIDDDEFRGGKIRLNDEDMDAVKLRAIWAAVRGAEDGEYVTVESDDENVRVARSGKYVLVNVEDRGRGRENVEVRIPEVVMDALLSGTGDELDLVAAVRALGEHGDGEIIRVVGDDEDVRIWVDSTHEGEGSR
jgi:hypothetical protein